MARSHLRTHMKNQSIRNSLLGIVGILIIFIGLFWFGPQLLVAFSELVINKEGPDKKTDTKGLTYVAPPILNQQPSATNSATIAINGSVTNGKTVKLFINGKSDKTTVKKDNTFSFKTVALQKGKNAIRAKVVTENDNESDYSQTITIYYLDKAPTLEITFPQDGQSIDHSPIEITGKTENQVKVTVNGFWAITNDDGTFSYRLNLTDGENKIKISATDEAENKTEKEITVKRE